MGYRLKLGKIPKSEKPRFHGKNSTDSQAMIGEDESLYYPPAHTQLFELGKYVTYEEHTYPFYSFDIYDEYESDFLIMTKAGLKTVIKEYHEKIRRNYQDLLWANDSEGTNDFLRSRAREWSRNVFGLCPYYLDQPPERSDGMMAASWQYEYSIFNLVYIYRTFDWENDYLIYSGW